MVLFDASNVPAPTPSWLGFTVIAAVVAGVFNLAIAAYGAFRAGRNGEKLELLRRGMDKSSLQEARAYTERLARVNPYVESLQACMQQSLDLGTNIYSIQELTFTPELKKLLLQSSAAAIGWDLSGVALSRLRFNIVLALKTRNQVISFLEKTAELNLCQIDIMKDVWEVKFEAFREGQARYLGLAVEIIDFLRASAREDVDMDKAEAFHLEPAEITRLIQNGALSELKIKIGATDHSWVAWWGFNDLVGPGEVETDIAIFLPVFDEVEAALRQIPNQLEIKSEREIGVEKTREKDGKTQTYKQHSLALHVRFPSQAALDSFAPVLESIKIQRRLIWASPFVPQEMRSS